MSHTECFFFINPKVDFSVWLDCSFAPFSSPVEARLGQLAKVHFGCPFWFYLAAKLAHLCVLDRHHGPKLLQLSIQDASKENLESILFSVF